VKYLSPEQLVEYGGPSFRRRGTFVACALLALAHVGGVAAGQNATASDVRNVLTLIPTGGIEADELAAQKLARMPADAFPVLLDALESKQFGTDLGDGEEEERIVDRGRELTILEAFRSAPPEAVRTCLRAEVKTTSTQGRRRAALSIYGAFGDAADLAVVMRLADAEIAADVLGDDFQEALASILRRDPDASRGVSGIIRSTSLALSIHLARAIGEAGSRESLPALRSLLEVRAELAELVLVQIERIASRNASPFPPDVIAAVRELLRSDDQAVAVAAVRAAGSLEDVAAVRELIELLDSRARRMRPTAHGALIRISGQRFHATRAMWSTWADAELAWWLDSSSTTLKRLNSSDPLIVIAAIQELVLHPLFRHELAAELASLAEHPDPRVSKLSCLALGQLGSAAAIPALDVAFRNPETVAEAKLALASIRTNATVGPLDVERSPNPQIP
jgi:HEAT repeat protein